MFVVKRILLVFSIRNIVKNSLKQGKKLKEAQIANTLYYTLYYFISASVLCHLSQLLTDKNTAHPPPPPTITNHSDGSSETATDLRKESDGVYVFGTPEAEFMNVQFC
jgi:hypothetical protein